MQDIHGIGPVLAQKLMAEVVAPAIAHTRYARPKHIYTPEELRRICRLPQIFPQLPVAAQADLRYNPLRRIPRDLIHIINGELHKYVRRTKFVIAGSYLRGKTSSSDIDIVLVADSLKPLYEVNQRSRAIRLLPPFLSGPDKAALYIEVKVPLFLQSLPLLKDQMTTTKKVRIKADVFLTKPKEYMYTLLFATGSGNFNVRMRAVAKKRGYLLNHKGLFKLGTAFATMRKVKVKDEEDLFRILGITYRLPSERER